MSLGGHNHSFPVGYAGRNTINQMMFQRIGKSTTKMALDDGWA
jgi:hypothetical protein